MQNVYFHLNIMARSIMSVQKILMDFGAQRKLIHQESTFQAAATGAYVVLIVQSQVNIKQSYKSMTTRSRINMRHLNGNIISSEYLNNDFRGVRNIL